MDTEKLSGIFTTLKGMLANTNSGVQWARTKAMKRPGVWGGAAQQGYTLGKQYGDWEILEDAEALKLHALGLTNQPRLRRRDVFMCSANIATQEFSLNCLGGMELHGNCIILNQTLETTSHGLLGRRTLISLNEHKARKIRLAFKMQDGLNCQVCFRIPKPFTIAQHLATCIWLDRIPEEHPGSGGYMVLEFL
jgi:hypothetical protein